jgi:hypothetical protein
MKDIRVLNTSREQHEGVLMHYNKLQMRSAEVEAMGMDFQKMAADAIAKAGFRQKPGPKKKKEGQDLQKKETRWPSALCHTHHVYRASGALASEKKLQQRAKAAPRELTKATGDNFREAMEDNRQWRTEVKHREELARLGPL